jgi:hypothetical protein
MKELFDWLHSLSTIQVSHAMSDFQKQKRAQQSRCAVTTGWLRFHGLLGAGLRQIQ